MSEKKNLDVMSLSCPIKNYDWGSYSAIPNLLGLPPSEEPVAEFWMGAHPSAPSTVEGVPLNTIISQNQVDTLGAKVISAHGRLPFLMKILAAERALSIQTHPALAQAQAGFTKENEQGVALDDFSRIYKDRSDKPELLVALSPFEVLCGFRPKNEIVDEFKSKGLSHLLPDGDGAAFYREIVSSVLDLDSQKRRASLEELEKGLGSSMRDRLLKQMCQGRPGDVGILMSLLLHHRVLDPGQGIFLEPGVLHAYVRGLGVEIMANSDNVIRAGFTSKHVDQNELKKIARFETFDFKCVPTKSDGSGWTVFDTPTEAFQLARLELTTSPQKSAQSDGPQILWIKDGRCTLSTGAQKLELSPQSPCFIPPGKEIELTGKGTCFLARMPLEPAMD